MLVRRVSFAATLVLCVTALAACGPRSAAVDGTPPRTTPDPVGGIFDAEVTVTLSCDDADGDGCATTHYTLDGSVPTTSSSSYSEPLALTETTTLNFFSVDAAGNAEGVQSHTYVIEYPPPADTEPPSTLALPAGDIYAHSVAVALACDDGAGSGCASTHYTLDGSDPDASSPVYGVPLNLNRDTVLKFLSVDEAGNTEAVQTEEYVIDLRAPITHVDPPGGDFASTRTVTLTCDDDTGSGCLETRFTLDGSRPDPSSTLYTAPFDVSADTTLSFYSVDQAGNAEEVQTLEFRVDGDAPVTTASQGGGWFLSTQILTLACDDGGGVGCLAIHYTLDGSAPGLGSPTYVTPLVIATDTEVRFFSVDAVGNEEAPRSVLFRFDAQAPTTTATPAGGRFAGTQTLTLACDDGAGSGCADTYYTVDGSPVSNASPVYTGPLTITADTTVQFFSMDQVGNAAGVRFLDFQIDTQAPVTTASLSGGLYTADQTLELACDDGSGVGCAAIHFTLDGSAPDLASPIYTGALLITVDTTVRFFSVDLVGNAEAPRSESFTFDRIAPTTTASPAGGLFTSAPSVSLACDDGGGSGCAAIHYTLDGSLPTTASPVHAGPISISADTTLRFFALDQAGNAEAVQTETYTVDGAAPTVSASPVGGLFNNDVLVVLSCDDGVGSGCATIHYTLDGNPPTTASPVYTGAFTLTSSGRVRALGVDQAGNVGPVLTETYNLDTTPPATVASPAGGEYAAAQTVSLSCTDPFGCAAIHFTLDGSLPTTASPTYGAPLNIASDTLLRFFAVDTAGNAEGAVSETYLIDTTAPSLSMAPAGGLFGTEVWVSVTCDDGGGTGCAAIHYTTDGTPPTTGSPLYVGPVSISTDTTLRALGVDRVGNQSVPMTQQFTIDRTPPVTVVAPAGGAYAAAQNVALSCSDASGCLAIYFTLDGSLPTTGSTLYTSPLNISADTTLRFFGVDLAGNAEGVVSHSYRIDATAPTLTVAPAGGLFANDLWVTLGCADGGGTGCAAIHYTTDGNIPTATSPVVTGPVALTADTRLRAVAFDGVLNQSNFIDESYTFDRSAPQTVATPAGGIYASAQSVVLGCSDASGCTTHYTTDGSLPTTSSPVATGPIAIPSTATLRFFSVDPVGNAEGVHTELYRIDGTPPVLTATPLGGAFRATLWVSLTCDDGAGEGCAAIHYTLDGSAPSLASPVYTLPLQLASDTRVRALAVDLAGNQSASRVDELYTFDYARPGASAAPAGGLYNASQTVVLSCTDAGSGCAAIHYTLDGSPPSLASPAYTVPLGLVADTTLRFFAVDVAGNQGLEVTEVYDFDLVAPTASASPAAGLYNSPQEISLACDDGAGSGCAAIHYTTNGSAATTASPLYVAPFTRSTNTVVRFLAVDVAGNQSPEGSALYTFDLVNPTTTASPAGGLFNAAQSVTLTCNDGTGSGCATTYYTTDGSDPTTASPTYSAPISVAASGTLKFRSTDVAGNLETIRTEDYTIDTVAPSVVTTFPADGATSVTLNPVLTVTWDEPLEPTSVGGATFSVDNGVTGTVSYDAGTNTMRFTPDAPFVYGVVYTASFTAGITDPAGNPISPGSFSFTTMDPPDLLSGISTANFATRGLALDASGNGVLVWVSKSGSGWRLLASYYDSTTSAFLPEVELYAVPNTSTESWTLSGEYTSFVGASLVASNGTTFQVVYPDGRDLVAREIVGGVVGAEQIISTGNSGNAGQANIIASGGEYLATFQEAQFADNRVHAIIHDGTGWGTDTVVEGQPNNVDVPVSAGYGGGWAVAWRNWYGSTHEIWVSRHDGTSWQAEELIGSGTVPQLASNGSGYALSYRSGSDAFGSIFDGTTWSVAAEFDGLSESVQGTAHLASDGSGYLASYLSVITVSPWTYKVRAQRYVAGAWTPAVEVVTDTVPLTVLDASPGPVAGGYVVAYRTREVDHPYTDLYGLRAVDFDGSTWGTPVDVETDPANVSQALLATAAGTTVVTFSQPFGETARQRARAFDGATWQPLEEAASSVHLGAAYEPTLVGNGSGQSVAVWLAQNVNGLLSVFTAHHDGASWSAPVVLSDPSYSGRAPALATDGTNFMVCYEEYPRGIAAREFDGTTWLAREQVSGATSAASFCDVASDGSRYAVVWKQLLSGAGSTYASVRTAGTWSAPAVLEAVSDPTYDPAIASNGTGFMAVWVQELFTIDSVFAAEYAFDGSGWSWGPATSIENTNAYARPVVDIVSNGTGYAALWTQYDTGFFNLRPRVAIHDGTGWTPGAAISTSHIVSSSYVPRIAPMGGDYLAAWKDGGRLYGARYSAGAWQAPIEVDSSTYEPTALHAIAGEARVSFPAWDGTGVSLYTRTFDGAAWGPRNLIEGDDTRTFSSSVGHDGSDWSIVWSQVDGMDPLVRDIQGRVGF
ncbi:MAG: chitobiase/beta-hexosaminidase C-terminal domain-containing protein [Deltaproteobacteria bacterium]|nr:chitobiase/beta-hexosaminidase C-terminal domain-containing protein [Deltaproteobacteria bacterium]